MQKNLKKLVVAMIIAALSIGAVACESKKNETTSAKPSTTTETSKSTSTTSKTTVEESSKSTTVGENSTKTLDSSNLPDELKEPTPSTGN